MYIWAAETGKSCAVSCQEWAVYFGGDPKRRSREFKICVQVEAGPPGI